MLAPPTLEAVLGGEPAESVGLIDTTGVDSNRAAAPSLGRLHLVPRRPPVRHHAAHLEGPAAGPLVAAARLRRRARGLLALVAVHAPRHPHRHGAVRRRGRQRATSRRAAHRHAAGLWPLPRGGVRTPRTAVRRRSTVEARPAPWGASTDSAHDERGKVWRQRGGERVGPTDRRWRRASLCKGDGEGL
jgi:hypothetical protein